MDLEAAHHFVRSVFKTGNQYEILFTLQHVAKRPASSVNASTDASVFRLRIRTAVKSDKDCAKRFTPSFFIAKTRNHTQNGDIMTAY